MKILIYSYLFLFIIACDKHTSIKNNTYEKATLYRNNKNEDSAFIFYYKAKEIFLENKDSLGAAKALINMSIIQCNQNDYYGSIETGIEVKKLLNNKKDSIAKNLLASELNTIAIASKNLKDFNTAIQYYQKAISITHNPDEKLAFENNIGELYLKIGNLKKAKYFLQKSLKTNNVKDRAMSLTNLAVLNIKQNPKFNALPELNQALQIRESEKDLWGQNASHAHLSDYFHEKNKGKSLFHAHKMLTIATELNSLDDQLEALQKLVLLETPENSKMFFLKYQKLNDSLQTARAKAKNQFALIRYETEKEKAENARKQNHILKQNIVIGTLIFGLFGGFFIYKRRKKRVQQENEIKVKNTQIKYSRKVHDVVANGLYHTMMQIQNNPDFSKEQTLNDIEKMYEESREIARDDLNEIQDKDFAKRLSEMLNSYSSEHQKVFIVGNDAEKWVNSSDIVQKEIYYVLREAMVNMVKHSRAKLTSIKIESLEKKISVKYTDNGIGISSSEKKSTSGIRNMENRIAAIGGTIIFEKNPSGGLIIQITIPIQ